jgi:parallel beta-helix repeat protein
MSGHAYRIIIAAAAGLFSAAMPFGAGSVCYSRTYYVDAAAGSDDNDGLSSESALATIQAGIDSAGFGDAVVVLPGRYTGIGNRDIDFKQKEITVRSADPADPEVVASTIVDCQKAGRGFYFHSGETTMSVVDGLTIVYGYGHEGGGIYCSNESGPTISNCTIRNNAAVYEGGGIYCRDSSPAISKCTVTGNAAPNGAGIVLRYGYSMVGDCTVTSNTAWSGPADGILCRGAYVYADGVTLLDGLHLDEGSWLAGTGRIVVEPDGRMVVSGGSTVALCPAGVLECTGLLHVGDTSRVKGTRMWLVRARFEGEAGIFDNYISTMPFTPYGQLVLADGASFSGNDIDAYGDRYIDVDMSKFTGLIADNDISVTVTEGRDGRAAGFFELRGRDPVPPPCEAGQTLCRVESVPPFSTQSWTVRDLYLAPGSNLILTNRSGFQPSGDLDGSGEVLFVKSITLGEGAVLNTQGYRVYYETFEGDPAGVIAKPRQTAFSLNGLDVNDQTQYLTRVVNNNFLDPIDTGRTRLHVERVTGLDPDPSGMMVMRNLPDPDTQQVVQARADVFFASTRESRFLVRFKYLFDGLSAGTAIMVYLKDVAEFLSHDDPLRAEHYIPVGRVLSPRSRWPGSYGSGRFGTFQKRVDSGWLDLSGGLRVELELVEPQSPVLYSAPPPGRGLAASSGSGGAGALLDDLNVYVYCDGICLDITWDDLTNEVDFLTVLSQCGLNADVMPDGTSRACLDGGFSTDGYVDSYDVHSWDWTIGAEARKNLCDGIPMAGGAAAAAYSGGPGLETPRLLASAGTILDSLLVTGKRGGSDGAAKMEDRFYVLDAQGAFVRRLQPVSDRSNVRLLRDAAGDFYRLSSEDGIVKLGAAEDVIIPPGEVSGVTEPRYGKTATVTVGIQGEGETSCGRPVLDAAIDDTHVYVVPVVVTPDGNDPYPAAAKLLPDDGLTPPYSVVKLYDDPATFDPANPDNPKLDGLRELELDRYGNLYVLNAYNLNESDMLWCYRADGTIDRVDLGDPGGGVYAPGPQAMFASGVDDMLYLASGQYEPEDVNSTVIHGLSTDGGLSPAVEITVSGMQHVTGIAEDPQTGRLWAVGFNIDPGLIGPYGPNPNNPPFYEPYLANIPSGSTAATAAYMLDSDPDNDIAMPLSIVWTEKCGGADFDGSDDVGWTDLRLMGQNWLADGCVSPDWCGAADLDESGSVALGDYGILAQSWMAAGCLDW